MIKKIIFLSFIFFTSLYAYDTNYELYKEAIKQKKYLKAKLYLLKTLDAAITRKNLEKVAIIYNKIGDIYKQTGEHYKAIEYYKLSTKLNLSQEKANQILLLKSYSNLSYSYTKVGNVFKAFKFSHKAVAIADKRYGKSSKQAKAIDKNIKILQSRLIEASI